MDAMTAIIFFALLPGVLDTEAQALWEDFEKEILNRNRYFPSSRVIEIFQTMRPSLEFWLETDKHIFRARKGNSLLLQEKIQSITRNEPALVSKGSVSQNMEEALNKIVEYMQSHFPESFFHKDCYYLGSDLQAWVKNKLSVYPPPSELFEKNHFWGYDKVQSDAPKQSQSVGRANPSGISYLYAAEDEQTAIAEIRPDIGEYVSIATIRPKKKLRLYNLHRSHEELEVSEEGIGDQVDWMIHRFSKHFSMPVLGDDSKYYATQYICEMIKTKLGFDGIRFKSAVNDEGSNIVLFDTSPLGKDNPDQHENYEIIRSKLIRVGQINYSIDPILPAERTD